MHNFLQVLKMQKITYFNIISLSFFCVEKRGTGTSMFNFLSKLLDIYFHISIFCVIL